MKHTPPIQIKLAGMAYIGATAIGSFLVGIWLAMEILR
jgi:hypothetical protein